MKWVTRHRPKIDRIARPWLIARFVDKGSFMCRPISGTVDGPVMP
jgi:hypothetical protein